MSVHAKYSPSKLPRIMKCPGSIPLIKELKDQGLIPINDRSSSAAKEGTMLHAVMEEALTKGYLQVTAAQVSKYELTNEHIDACNNCLGYVQVLKMSIPKGLEYKEYVEKKVTLGGTPLDLECPELKDVYGTVDYILMYNRKLIIVDWKFGKGVEVWPDSAQTKAYASASISLYKAWASTNTDLDITIVIGQPRIPGENFKALRTTLEALDHWLCNELIPALQSINSKNPVFSPSDKTCMWCPVKLIPHACTARFDMVKDVTSKAFEAFKYDESFSEALELLKKKPIVDKFFKDLLLYTTNKLKHGEKVPGYKMVRGRSTRVFKTVDANKVPTDFLHWVEEKLNRDPADFVISQPMSAPQAEKLLTKRVLKDYPDFYDLIHKPEGKLTLAVESDPREAVDFETAGDAFSAYVEND